MARRCYYSAWPNQDDGENIYRLELSDDGEFTYSEEWCTYAWNIGKSAKGRWELTADELTLHVEESEIYNLTPPMTVKAVRRQDGFELGGGVVMTLVASPANTSPKREDASQKDEFEREVEKFERSLRIAPSKLVK